MSLFGNIKDKVTGNNSDAQLQKGVTMLIEAVKIISKEKSNITKAVDDLNEIIDVIYKHSKKFNKNKAKEVAEGVSSAVGVLVDLAKSMNVLSKVRIRPKLVINNIEAMKQCIDSVLGFAGEINEKIAKSNIVSTTVKLTLMGSLLMLMVITFLPLLLLVGASMVLVILLFKGMSMLLDKFDKKKFAEDLAILKIIFSMFFEIITRLTEYGLGTLIATLIKLGPIYLLMKFIGKILDFMVKLAEEHPREDFLKSTEFLASVIAGVIIPIKEYVIEYVNDIKISQMIAVMLKYLAMILVLQILKVFLQALQKVVESMPLGQITPIVAWLAAVISGVIVPFKLFIVDYVNKSSIKEYLAVILKYLIMMLLVVVVTLFLDVLFDASKETYKLILITIWVAWTGAIIVLFKKRIVDTISEIKFTEVVKNIIKLVFLHVFVKKLSKVLRKITKLGVWMLLLMPLAIPGLYLSAFALNFFIEKIFNKILDLKFKDIIVVDLKTKKLTKSTIRTTKLITAIVGLGAAGYVVALFIPGLVFSMLALVIYTFMINRIKKTKTFLVGRKINKLIKLTYKIKRLLKKIMKIPFKKGLVPIVTPYKLAQLLFAAMAVITLVVLIHVILASTPIMLVLALIAPVIMLAVKIIMFTIKFILKQIAKLASSPAIFKAVLVILLLTLAFVIIGVGLYILGQVVSQIMDVIWDILLFMVFLAAFVVLIALFGWLSTLLVPFLEASVVGFAAIGAAVLAMLGITEALKKLETIQLDEKKIEENVKKVLGLVGLIYMWLFAPTGSSSQSAQTEDPSVFQMLGSTVVKLLASVVASWVLIQAAISVLSILVMAWMLRAIQLLRLDEAKIKHNVHVVLNIVNFIIQSIFAPDTADTSESDRKEIGGIFSHIQAGIISIVMALAAAATLFLMIIAVGAILFIAGLLNLIQLLKLDETRIIENVNLVLSTCAHIIAMVFEPDDAPDKKSNRGVFISLISWVFGDAIANILQAIFTVVYLALMVIAVALILAIGGMLITVARLDEGTLEDAKERAKQVLGIAQAVINNVFYSEDKDTKYSQRGVLVNVIQFFFGKGLADVFIALLSIAYLFLMMIAVALIKVLGSQLTEIADLDKDTLDKAKDKAEKVLTVTHTIMDNLMNDDSMKLVSKKDDGLFGKLLGWISPDLKTIIDAIMTVIGLALAELAIGSIHRIATKLKEIAEIDVDPTKAITNATLAMKGVGIVINQVSKMPDNVDEDTLEKFDETFGKMADIFDKVASIGGNFKKLEEMDTIDPKKIPLIAAKANFAILATVAIADEILGIKKLAASIQKTTKEDESIFAKAGRFFVGDKLVDALHEQDYNDDIKRAVEAKIKQWKWKFEQIDAVAGLMASITGSIFNAVESVSKLQDLKVPESKVVIDKASAVNAMMDDVAKALLPIDSGVTNMMDPVKTIQAFNDRKKIIESANKLVGAYAEQSNSLISLIEAFDKIKVEDNESKRTTLGNIVDKYIEIHDKLSQSLTTKQKADFADRIKAIRDINRYVGDIKVSDKDVENLGKQTDNYIRFFEKVNQMKMANLNKATELMKYWAAIARSVKGDFNKLAEAINEHVYPAITTLNETMDGVKKSQDKIFEELTKDVNINIAGAGGTMETPSSPGGAPSESVSTGGVGDLNDSTDSPFPARKPQSGSMGDLPMEGNAIRVVIVDKNGKIK